MTMRLAAVALMAMLVGWPLAVWPSPVLVGLAVPGLVVGGAGVIARSVPLATAGAALALIEYALALVIAQPRPDPVTGIAFGAGLVLLLASVHFTGRAHGAALGPSVIRSQVRHWLAIVALGAVGATLLTVGGEALGLALRGAALPVVVAAAALGALATVAGVVGLVSRS